MQGHSGFQVITDNLYWCAAKELEHVHMTGKPCFFIHACCGFHVDHLTVWHCCNKTGMPLHAHRYQGPYSSLTDLTSRLQPLIRVLLYVARIVFICRKFLVIFGKCYIGACIHPVFLTSGTVFFPKEFFCDACLL